jgi:hypothetical protein
MHAVRWIAIIATAVVLVPLLTMITLWIASLPIWQFEPDDCVFNTVSNTQYRNMLDLAKRQPWTVWPGLSDGLFWPSDRGWKNRPSPQFENVLGNRFRGAVDELIHDRRSADMELAAAHALMRSIGAHLVSAFEILGFPERDRHIVQFRYFLPQRRFAPLCLTCLIWRYTTIAVNFEHDLAANAYQLDDIIVLHGDLKYDPDPIKERNVSTNCPAFPVTNRK